MKTKQIIGIVLTIAAIAGIGYFGYKFLFKSSDGGGEGNGGAEEGDTGDGSGKGAGKGFGKTTTK